MINRSTSGVTGLNEVWNRNASIRALQGDSSLVYAVLTGDGYIKIGVTKNLVQRIQHIRGGCKQILAIKPGTFADEREIHQSLKGHAAEGREFYLPTPSVLKVVNTMRAPLGLEPIIYDRKWAS